MNSVLAKRLVLLALFLLMGASQAVLLAQQTGTAIPGTTRAIVNMRSGPGTRFAVIQVLPADLPLTFVGRNASSTWLQAIANGQTGWLSYTFVNVLGSVPSLPVVDGNAPVEAPVSPTEPQFAPPPMNPDVEPAMPGVVPQISATTREIYERGQQLGNRAAVFSKVGDSITASALFLNPIGLGGLRLHDYAYLQPVVDFFSQVPAGDHYSFANTSMAARGGWSSRDVLDPARSVRGVCGWEETPLACEYRLTRPSIALIMLGTNDLNWMESAVYRSNMETIIQFSIEQGVIPVLSTIPDQPLSPYSFRVGEFNAILMDIAFTYDIPLWNYWLALQDLPNRGLGQDNVHPSYDPIRQETAIFTPEGLRYGYNMRNLTALMVLDAIWRGAMY